MKSGSSKTGTIKPVLRFLLAGLALFTVTVLAGAVTLRLAIHGREVTVPNLSGKSDADSAAAAKDLGLNLSVDNRFYSAAIPPNHILSQSPAAGSRVRRGWTIRVAESLGGQHIQVPDLLGQGERASTLVLRRQLLEVGTVVRIASPGAPGVVLAQSPPPNSAGLDGPRVALLVSDDQAAAASAAAYVMPTITGMTLAEAGARLSSVNLHIASAQQAPAVDAAPVATDASTPDAPAVAATPLEPVVPVPVSPDALIVSQSPAPGHRVSRADAIRVTLATTPSLPSQPSPP